MSYLKISEVRAAAQAYQARQPLRKSADAILSEAARSYSPQRSYDVFLSHSREDGDLILGVKAILEGNGLSVYVDWVEDPQLDRSNVNAGTADVLRKRMRNCKQLVFATSQNSPSSKWMPWELGYFDGHKDGGVWVLPIVKDYDSEFKGQEYLQLYPVLDKVSHSNDNNALGLIEGRSAGSPGTIMWLSDVVKGNPRRYPLIR